MTAFAGTAIKGVAVGAELSLTDEESNSFDIKPPDNGDAFFIDDANGESAPAGALGGGGDDE